MSQAHEDFESMATAKFSHGPEKDTSVDEEHIIASLLNELPQEISSAIESMDPFTRQSFMSAYEDQLKIALKEGKELGEEAVQYATDYEQYGWQYDETQLVPSLEIKAVFDRRRNVLLSRVATGLRQQIELRGENDE
jgi:hypothetical protein